MSTKKQGKKHAPPPKKSPKDKPVLGTLTDDGFAANRDPGGSKKKKK